MAGARLVLSQYMPARDRSDRLVAGARLRVLVNRSSSENAAIFSDSALTTPLANPVIANSSGQFADIWADDADLYTLSITGPNGESIGNPSVFDDYSTAIVYGDDIVEEAEAARDEALQAVVDAEAQVALATDQVALAAAQVALATAQAALANAERVLAEAARDLAEGYASDAATVSGVNVPIYASKASLAGAVIAAAVDRVYVNGYATAGDGGEGYYKRAASDPSRPYTSVQDSTGDWWELDAGEQVNSAQYGFDTTADCAARALAMLAENPTKPARVKKSANGDPYISSRWLLTDTTRVHEIILEDGVVIGDMPAPAAASVGWLRVSVGVKVRLWGFGATITQTSRATSSCINSSGCGMLHIFGLTIVGAGGTSVSNGSDCLYLGGNGTTGTFPSSNVHVRWVDFSDAYRNVVSIVEGHNVTIEDFVFHGAQSTPGAGIDFEANRYSTDTGRAPMRNILIRNGICRDNNKNGVTFIFCDDVLVENVICYDNGENGFASSAGGANHDEGRAREGKEVSAIEAFATDGWITVPSAYWANMEIGTVCKFGTRNGATTPTELSASYHLIVEKDATGTKIRVSANAVDTITSVTVPGSGTYTSDRWTSDFYLTLFQDGSCGGITLRNCTAYDNGAEGVSEVQFLFNQVVGLRLEDCKANQRGNSAAFNVAYSRSVRRIRCKVTGDQPAVATVGGFSTSTSSFVRDEDLEVRDNKGPGLTASSVLAYELDRLKMRNVAASGNAVTLSNLRNPLISGIFGRGDPSGTWAGLTATSNVINGQFKNCDVTGLGTSDANSFSVSSTSIVANCLNRSGIKYGTASKTHDFASIAANSFGASTTLPATGAMVGQPCRANMSAYTAGLVLHAVCSANNTITVTPQNITGASIDPASGTLSAQVIWAQ